DGVERRIEASAGDYVYVPPYVPHREENPSHDEEAIVVLARTTQEGIVVNLPSLRVEVPELDRIFAELASEADGWGDLGRSAGFDADRIAHRHLAGTDNPGVDAERDAPLTVVHHGHSTVPADLAERVRVPLSGVRIPRGHGTTWNRPDHVEPDVA